MANDNIVEFILDAYPAHRGFSSYRGEDGNLKTYCEELDKKGNPKSKNINFKPNQRIYRVSKSEKDLNGVPLWEYIKNSPHCKDSPISKGRHDAYIRIYNAKEEAKSLVEVEMLKNRALNLALHMDTEEMTHMAHIAGCFDPDLDIQRKYVVQYAKSKPSEFLSQVKSDDMPIESLIRYAKQIGLLTTNKLKWHYKATDDSDPTYLVSGSAAKVIDYLKENREVLNAIREQVNDYAKSQSKD